MTDEYDEELATGTQFDGHRTFMLIMLFAAVGFGCNRDEGTLSVPRASGPQRVLLVVPPGYKIVNESPTLLVLRSGHIRITIFRMDQREFQIRKTSRSNLAVNERKTQFGDVIVPAIRFDKGEAAGWKFAILDKKTGKPVSVEYLLSVKAGYVRLDIDSDNYEPFDETAIEPLLATVSVGEGEPLGGDDHETYGRKPEYDLTKSPARLRIFAGNHQFLVYEFEADPFEPFPVINEKTSHQGWTRNPHALWVFTRAPRNVHRLDVRLSGRYDPDSAAVRQTVHNLRLPSGMLALFEHPNHVKFRVPPGDYMIYCRAYNLGKEGDAMRDLPDDQFFEHEEWERYELILVPGVAGREGLL